MDILISLLPFLISAIVIFLIALVVGRWWVVLLPVVGWSVFNIGLHAGWWLRPGSGEGLATAFFLEMFSGVVAAAAGVMIRRDVRARRTGPARTGSGSPGAE